MALDGFVGFAVKFSFVIVLILKLEISCTRRLMRCNNIKATEGYNAIFSFYFKKFSAA
jgi:hypothetical protein